MKLLNSIKELVALQKATRILKDFQATGANVFTPEKMTVFLTAIGVLVGPTEDLLPEQYRVEIGVGLAAAYIAASYIANKEGGSIPVIPGIPTTLDPAQLKQVVDELKAHFPFLDDIEQKLKDEIAQIESTPPAATA